SGGGHAYAVFANTAETKETIQLAAENINNWFIDNYGDDLYLACGYTECSANELMNIGDKNVSSYSQIFVRLSHVVGKKKLQRYTAKQLKRLNNRSEKEHERECKICFHGSRNLNKENICESCKNFIDISTQLAKPATGSEAEILAVVLKEKPDEKTPSVKLPSLDGGDEYLALLSTERITEALSNGIVSPSKIYGENYNGRNIPVGTCAFWVENKDKASEMIKFDDMAKYALGVNKIAVLRADVDNLGAAFISGFDSSVKKGKSGLQLTSVFSHHLSLFFKTFISDIF
ncbi:MAG TPA: hypothetical protein VHO66_00740, partial [Ruminiclostridium sp.]|nr:hypothetical protein [Ruminiclostridium sp.]